MSTIGHRPASGRRAFLLGAAAALGGLAATPSQALPFLRRADPSPPEQDPRGLVMINQRTEEVYNEIFFDGRAYLEEPLERFAQFARDLRTGETGEFDPHLLDLAAALQARTGAETPLILTHGFRSSAQSVRRGAANSFHLHGRALDVAHPGMRARELHQHAAALGRGGLGRYPTFIHIDTGPTRRW